MIVSLLALLAALAPQGTSAPTEATLVLAGGDVVDLESGELRSAHDVWIAGDRIEAVVPSGQRTAGAGTEVVDVRGRTLAPGLVDAHVHLDHVDEKDL